VRAFFKASAIEVRGKGEEVVVGILDGDLDGDWLAVRAGGIEPPALITVLDIRPTSEVMIVSSESAIVVSSEKLPSLSTQGLFSSPVSLSGDSAILFGFEDMFKITSVTS
jgi:hypothetical protein